jgi:hypothetical protein
MSDLLDPRAVLGPVKAWPGKLGARDEASATASLGRPLARGAPARAGRDEGTGHQARTKEQCEVRSYR